MNLVTPDIGLIFWQTLTFLIVLGLLAKFAWKPITNALKEREADIDEALAVARKTKEEMLKIQSDNEKLLAEARKERDKMLKEAQSAASNMISEAKEKAGVEAGRMIETARITINNEKLAAIAEVKNQATQLSIQIAEKLLKRELTDEKLQRELVDEYMKDAKLN